MQKQQILINYLTQQLTNFNKNIQFNFLNITNNSLILNITTPNLLTNKQIAHIIADNIPFTPITYNWVPNTNTQIILQF